MSRSSWSSLPFPIYRLCALANFQVKDKMLPPDQMEREAFWDVPDLKRLNQSIPRLASDSRCCFSLLAWIRSLPPTPALEVDDIIVASVLKIQRWKWVWGPSGDGGAVSHSVLLVFRSLCGSSCIPVTLPVVAECKRNWSQAEDWVCRLLNYNLCRFLWDGCEM